MLTLRDVTDSDLPTIFEHQRDPEGQHMAAFISTDPDDWDAFSAKWHGIMANPDNVAMVILLDGEIVGNMLAFPHEGKREVGYWIAREHWGKGIATQALEQFLDTVETTRPLHAAAAKDNVGSLRVLEKCGFEIVGEGKGFSNARGEDVEEFLLELRAS